MHVWYTCTSSLKMQMNEKRKKFAKAHPTCMHRIAKIRNCILLMSNAIIVANKHFKLSFSYSCDCGWNGHDVSSPDAGKETAHYNR